MRRPRVLPTAYRIKKLKKRPRSKGLYSQRERERERERKREKARREPLLGYSTVNISIIMTAHAMKENVKSVVT
jgi:hypothetical protein